MPSITGPRCRRCRRRSATTTRLLFLASCASGSARVWRGDAGLATAIVASLLPERQAGPPRPVAQHVGQSASVGLFITIAWTIDQKRRQPRSRRRGCIVGRRLARSCSARRVRAIRELFFIRTHTRAKPTLPTWRWCRGARRKSWRWPGSSRRRPGRLRPRPLCGRSASLWPWRRYGRRWHV